MKLHEIFLMNTVLCLKRDIPKTHFEPRLRVMKGGVDYILCPPITLKAPRWRIEAALLSRLIEGALLY